MLVSVAALLISAPTWANAAGRAAASAPAHATVVLRDIGFHAPTAVVARGGTVTWQWRDGDTASGNATSHTVTSTGSPRFRSAAARNHGSYTARFSTAGTYRYECTIHVGMTGRVTVR